MKTGLMLMITAMMFATLTLTAQDDEGVSFGIRAGINFQNVNGEDRFGNDLDNDMLTKWHAGINVEIPLAPDFYFQPGLLFTSKGANFNYDKLNNDSVLVSVENNVGISYLELPLNLMYKPELGSGRLITGFGPYVAYGFAGTARSIVNGVEETYDVIFEDDVQNPDLDDPRYVNPWDYGLNLTAGYELNMGLLFQLNAQWGLANIYGDYETADDDNVKWSHTGFGFSVGYRFK